MLTNRYWGVVLFLLLLAVPALADNHELADTEREAQVWLAEPNYFIFDDDGDVKFLVATSLRAFKFSHYTPWAPDFDVTMRIKAFWALATKPSQPLTEINWNPEFVLRWELPEDRAWFLPHDISLGRAHESDGVASDTSRGWDRWISYVNWELPMPADESYLDLKLTGWHVAAYEHHWAPDMPTYLGMGNILFVYREPGWFIKAEGRITDNQRAITAEAVRNANGRRPHPQFHPDEYLAYTRVPLIPSMRFGAGVKLPWDWEDLYGYAEYFTGYGEGLVHFNERSSVFRLGLAFVPDR